MICPPLYDEATFMVTLSVSPSHIFDPFSRWNRSTQYRYALCGELFSFQTHFLTLLSNLAFASEMK